MELNVEIVTDKYRNKLHCRLLKLIWARNYWRRLLQNLYNDINRAEAWAEGESYFSRFTFQTGPGCHSNFKPGLSPLFWLQRTENVLARSHVRMSLWILFYLKPSKTGYWSNLSYLLSFRSTQMEASRAMSTPYIRVTITRQNQNVFQEVSLYDSDSVIPLLEFC